MACKLFADDDDLVRWKPGNPVSICEGCYHGARCGSVKELDEACGMRGLGWLVDGPIKPTLNRPQTQNRDRLAVQARGGLDRGNISKLAPKSVKDGKSSQDAARP